MLGKKGFFILIFLLVFIPFVSAQSSFSQAVKGFIGGVSDVVEPIAKILIGDIAGSGSFDDSDVLWSKFLFLILIFSVVYIAFERVEFFSSNGFIHFIITLVVALLATRWIGDAEFIQSLLLPYSALGIALSAGIPFVAWFLIVNVGMSNSADSVRRIAWVLFGVTFIFLWGSRYSDITGGSNWIYVVTFIIAFIMAVMDGTIRKFFVKMDLEKMEKGSAEEAIVGLQAKLVEIDALVASDVLTSVQAEKRKKKIMKKIAYLSKHS
jgi:hypothetical protein